MPFCSQVYACLYTLACAWLQWMVCDDHKSEMKTFTVKRKGIFNQRMCVFVLCIALLKDFFVGEQNSFAEISTASEIVWKNSSYRYCFVLLSVLNLSRSNLDD